MLMDTQVALFRRSKWLFMLLLQVLLLQMTLT